MSTTDLKARNRTCSKVDKLTHKHTNIVRITERESTLRRQIGASQTGQLHRLSSGALTFSCHRMTASDCAAFETRCAARKLHEKKPAQELGAPLPPPSPGALKAFQQLKVFLQSYWTPAGGPDLFHPQHCDDGDHFASLFSEGESLDPARIRPSPALPLLRRQLRVPCQEGPRQKGSEGPGRKSTHTHREREREQPGIVSAC